MGVYPIDFNAPRLGRVKHSDMTTIFASTLQAFSALHMPHQGGREPCKAGKPVYRHGCLFLQVELICGLGIMGYNWDPFPSVLSPMHLLKLIKLSRRWAPCLFLALALLLPFGCKNKKLSASAVPTAPQAFDLRVESQANPLGLGTTSPRFSWSIADPDRGATQDAYRILVASSEQLLDSDQGDLFDSGRTASSQQLFVPYAGAPLSTRQRYYWKVQLWDESGLLGPWSETGTFDLMPDPSEWTASYLWDGTQVDNDTAYLRTSFTLDQPANLAKIYVSAHEELSLWVNGTHVLYGPAPADPYKGMRVVALDVTALLAEGENVFAGRVNWSGSDGGAGVRGEPAFILEADIDLVDGTRTTLVSDATWRVLADTPYDESAPLRGPSFGRATVVEDFDARLEPLGWRSPGFDDSTWDPATVVQPLYQLSAQRVPSQTIVEELPALSASLDQASGAIVVDFGRNVSGWISLRIPNANAGDRLTVWYSEELQAGRIIRDRDEISDMWDAYTCAGGGSDVWEPDTGYLGFRYIEIEGYPGDLNLADISLMRFGTPLEQLGNFSSSSVALDDVYRICLETQESCAQGLLVDCPQREQAQHMTDALIQGDNLASHYRETNLLAKCLRDIRDGHLGGGILQSRYPSERLTIIPEWSLSWIHGIDLAWMQTADTELLSELYPVLVQVLDDFGARIDPATGLLLTLPISSYGFQGLDVSTPGLATLNCLYYEALRVGKDAARTLNNITDEMRFSDAQITLGESIRANLFDGTDRYLDGIGSSSKIQLSSALPILFGIETGARAQALAESVRQDILQAGTVGGYYVTRALRLWDFGDELLSAFEDDADEHWGNMLLQGATTTFEDWEGSYSLAHAWSAYPMARVLDTLVGIAPLGPGWSQVEIRPRIADSLSFAEGTVPTPRGDVFARWEAGSDLLSLTLTTPANMPALVSLPFGDLNDVLITEGGQVLFEEGQFMPTVPGITYNGIEIDYLLLNLVPGSYEFQISGTP